jgi:phosphoglycerate kinase
MKLRNLAELGDLRGKYVLLRDDLNLQIVDGIVTDGFRLSQSLPTIRVLQSMGARVAVISHLGRPDGEVNLKYTLAPVAVEMAKHLGVPVKFVPDSIGDCVAAARAQMKDGDVILLENVRFYSGEEANDPEFAAQLAAGFDAFVNDAFAVSHRAHASVVGVAKLLPSAAGILLESEIANISVAMDNPERPLLAIVAGAKISSKIGVLKAMSKFADKLIIGGALGTTFQFALGEKVGNSLHEPGMKQTALEVLEYAKKNGCEIILPRDKAVTKIAGPDADAIDRRFGEIQDDDIILDAGKRSIVHYIGVIDYVKTVIWNGTVGMAEWRNFQFGSFSLARHIALRTQNGDLRSYAGGGDTVAALEATDTAKDFTYVSTGGGAFLEFIEGRDLPGVSILANKLKAKS